MPKKDSKIKEELQNGLNTAFVDEINDSNLAYRPEFVSNDWKKGEKVISSIEKELTNCDAFSISVAFITKSGITPLLQTFQELEANGIPGRILTTDYLTFSEPDALDKLSELKNIELKIYRCDHEHADFHTKGYIFRNGEVYRIIIGSSNMTLKAITTNREWNTKIVGLKSGEMVSNVLDEFESLWIDECSLPYQEYRDLYRTRYEMVDKQRRIATQGQTIQLRQYQLKPNSMQTAFTARLRELLSRSATRALLISATGTGKTYASAFGVRDALMKSFKTQDKQFRVLFIVHREQIAAQAMESYKTVFGEDTGITYGLFAGNRKNSDRDFVFSTIQTLSKEENLKKFNPKVFDVIVIDEVHHAGAETYQRVIDYFHPRFLLGMTATPERTDSYDIFELFDHNVAYEIRLQQAMEEDLLCPFHYFGITDIALDGSDISEKDVDRVDSQVARGDFRVFNRLTADTRVDDILKQAEYFGYSGSRVKGLIFVSTKSVGKELSNKMNERGVRTLFLSGEDSQDVRQKAIESLTSDDIPEDQMLDYIISVDIFGEGADIPEINQVIKLRPTQSAIVFVQQLGRGLRKSQGKEYLVVLDFIGAFNSNFLIPIALSGDRTYNKDNMRKYIMQGESIIPGASTIHFDKIAKKRIFDAIDKATTKKKFLSEKYFNLKNRLGHIPSIVEFYEYGEVDPALFIDYGDVYEFFVESIDKDYSLGYSEEELVDLSFVSKCLANGKRPHELVMLRQLIQNGWFDADSIKAGLTTLSANFRYKDYRSAVRVLDKLFMNTQSEKTKYASVSFINESDAESVSGDAEFSEIPSNRIRISDIFRHELEHDGFRKAMNNLVEYGLMKYHDYFSDGDEDNLVLYQKYSRKDACRILDWEKDDSQTLYGYRIKYNTCPIFVTYEKRGDIADSTKYQDEFYDSNQIFSWMTRSKVKIGSPEAQALIHQKDNGLKVYLFIKKSDGEGSDFYYMGRCRVDDYNQTTITNDKKEVLPIMNFKLYLKHAARNDIYEYLTN